MEQLYAGVGAGLVSKTLTAPLDIMAIRLQIQAEPRARTYYSTLPSTARKLYAEQGLATFWRGCGAAQVESMAYYGIQFGIYYHPALGDEPVVCRASAAGLAATLVTYPVDIVHTQFASQGTHVATRRPPFESYYELTRHMIRTKQMTQGLGLTLARTVPYISTSFYVYEKTESGLLSGVLSKALFYPLDTVKKRLQVQHLVRDPRYGCSYAYRHSLECMRHIHRTQGIRSFYRGMVPTCLKTGAGTGVAFFVHRHLVDQFAA